VVTNITPFAPREPYIAVAEASFNTSIDAISEGFNELSEPPIKPSITTNGPLSACIEFIPRTRIVEEEPGCPEEDTILTPAKRP